MSDKILLFEYEGSDFFDDMTYRCHEWKEGEYTKIKLTEDGDVLFCHAQHCDEEDENNWYSFNKSGDSQDARAIIRKYNAAMTSIMEMAFELKGE